MRQSSCKLQLTNLPGPAADNHPLIRILTILFCGVAYIKCRVHWFGVGLHLKILLIILDDGVLEAGNRMLAIFLTDLYSYHCLIL